MTSVVIDASIAIKWIVEEEGTAAALAVRRDHKLLAPDLLISECANVLWKKVVRSELEPEEAGLAARLLSRADIELFGTRAFLETATRLAMQIRHPAYDCMYLALAMDRGCNLLTADEEFARKVHANGPPELAGRIALLGRT